VLYFFSPPPFSSFPSSGVVRDFFAGQGSHTCADAVYHAAQIQNINAPALTYFAASMFWRAAVREWTVRGGATQPIELGPYREQFRTYLAGETPFPKDCVLWVSVPATLMPFVALSLTPYGLRRSTHHVYMLIILGVGFHRLVGAGISQAERAMCFVRGTGNPICRTDLLEQGALQDMNREFQKHPHLVKGPKRRK
jgi:hypothetical protein